jgi:hypothetical protein
MKESIESPKEYFKYPDIEAERGEFERVARTFNADTDTLMFLAEEEGGLISLNASTWEVLENTDSSELQPGDWELVKEHSVNQDVSRDWESLKARLEQGEQTDAPIIMEHEGKYHLVSGNTRLMVARALGITPTVLIFEYKEDRTNE